MSVKSSHPPSLPPLNQDGRVLISGGTKGLGFAVACELARNGVAALTLTGRNADDGKAAAQALQALGTHCTYVQGDMGDSDACQNALGVALSEMGAITGLVNAAADTARGSILDTSLSLWERQMAVNLRAPFLLMQGVARHLVETGKAGSMVNILSTSAYVGQSFLAPYTASKGGLLSLTKNAAQALRQHQIRVNAIAPGWMDTPAEDAIQKSHHNAPDNWLEVAEANMPFKQLAKPHQIAPLIAWLLSPQSGIITGAVIDYDQQIVGQMPE